ncbi:MAG: hypothetical protein VYE10_01155 [Candidatus Thermoplasmatota archaeon]|nr:hypothetical protein [Candidatus Thermoplasmatota archaeon]
MNSLYSKSMDWACWYAKVTVSARSFLDSHNWWHHLNDVDWADGDASAASKALDFVQSETVAW